MRARADASSAYDGKLGWWATWKSLADAGGSFDGGSTRPLTGRLPTPHRPPTLTARHEAEAATAPDPITS